MALPQLQRSRRDTQRRSDVIRLGSLLKNVAANNNGSYPADGIAIINALDFATHNLIDPSTGNPYTVSTPTPTTAVFDYDRGGSCSATGTVTNGASLGGYALAIRLETGGYACIDTR